MGRHISVGNGNRVDTYEWVVGRYWKRRVKWREEGKREMRKEVCEETAKIKNL